MDSAHFLESLAGNFMDVVQYNEDNRAFEVCVWLCVWVSVCGCVCGVALVVSPISCF